MKYKNKIIATILAIMLALSTTVLTSCGDDKNTDETKTTTTSQTKNSTDKNTKNTTDEVETETRTEVVTDDEGEVVEVITITEPATDKKEENNKSNSSGGSSNNSSSGNSGNNSSSGNSGTGSGTTKPTQKPTEKPTQKPTEKPTEKPTQPPTNPPTEPPTEAPTEPPVSSPYIYPFDPYVIEQDMINYGISQGLTYDSSLTFGNCGYNAPDELNSYFDSPDKINIAKYNACYGAIDSVVNMVKNDGYDDVSVCRFRPYLEPLSNGGYLVYCFYG